MKPTGEGQRFVSLGEAEGTAKSANQKRTVDSLILALLINVVEVSQHLDGRNVRPGVVNDPLRSILDEVLEEDESLQRCYIRST
jgi:hypothetical protein